MLGPRVIRLAAAVVVSVAALSFVGPPVSAAPAPSHQWDASELIVEPLGAPLVANGAAYRGRFRLRVEGGTIRLVNEVAVEDYVRGIREMPPSWPIEAQRAQAIAARSYALHQAVVARQEGRRSDLCATASCQVYGGIAAEQRGGATWARAVESTAAEVLAYRGAPILAMYSSSNGGRSVAASKPYLRAVPDPDDAASPHHRWRVEVPETAVGAAVALPEGAELTGVERAGGLVVATWQGPLPEAGETARPMPVAEFRSRLEAAHPPPPGLPRLLPSTFFGMAAGTEPGNVVIEGRGWGHGIGMSQHGALGKARRGMTARAILAVYYAGLTPVTAAPGQVPNAVRVDIGGGAALSVGGLGAFRLAADGVGVATGVGEAGWKVAAVKGRVRVSAPKGWQPPQPQQAPTGDPFTAAEPQAGATPVFAAARVGGLTGVDRLWGWVALTLLGAVSLAVFRLRDRPDLGPLPRG